MKKIKKLKCITISALLTVSLFSFTLGNASAAQSVKTTAKLPGKEVSVTSTITDEQRDFTGYVINGRTYVNFIGILDCLPFLVNSKALSFDAQTKVFKIYSNEFADNPTPLYQFQVGKSSFLADNFVVKMDSTILISNSRIYIPLKEFVKYQNFKITYNQTSHIVLVSK